MKYKPQGGGSNGRNRRRGVRMYIVLHVSIRNSYGWIGLILPKKCDRRGHAHRHRRLKLHWGAQKNVFACMAGLGYLVKTVREPQCQQQRGGVNFDPPHDFLCLFYAKCSSCFRNALGLLSHKIKKFCPQNVFWGPRLAVVTPPPYTKT
jgi:hypothetical protein